MARANVSRERSLNAGPWSCAETGRPEAAPRPIGTETPPLPAMLLEIVNMSEAYISVGSLISPRRKAVRGLAGMRMTSHFS